MEFDIESASGFSARFSDYGARLVSLWVPDALGRCADVVVGHDTADAFKHGDRYAGATCGRFANRIAGARFDIDGQAFTLVGNEGANQLHGGPDGFHNRVWDAAATKDAVRFTLVSPDGDQGYPGELTCEAEYGLRDDVLWCELTARSDRPTIVNLTQHAYWNLEGGGTIAGHRLRVAGHHRTPVGAGKIPTGEVVPTAGTPYDFREFRSLGDMLKSLPDGLDDNYCLDGPRGTLRMAATVEAGGRRMEVHTTEPGLQVYTAAHHGPGYIGKGGVPLARFGAIALEPQTYPNAPNTPAFPAALLRPPDVYRHRIEWRFSEITP